MSTNPKRRKAWRLFRVLDSFDSPARGFILHDQDSTNKSITVVEYCCFERRTERNQPRRTTAVPVLLLGILTKQFVDLVRGRATVNGKKKSTWAESKN
jgi:hypothetical protein